MSTYCLPKESNRRVTSNGQSFKCVALMFKKSTNGKFWWFGARWFGFLGSPYERDCYLRLPLQSQTTGPQTTSSPVAEKKNNTEQWANTYVRPCQVYQRGQYITSTKGYHSRGYHKGVTIRGNTTPTQTMHFIIREAPQNCYTFASSLIPTNCNSMTLVSTQP